jgi:hypothetical protein
MRKSSRGSKSSSARSFARNSNQRDTRKIWRPAPVASLLVLYCFPRLSGAWKIYYCGVIFILWNASKNSGFASSKTALFAGLNFLCKARFPFKKQVRICTARAQ